MGDDSGRGLIAAVVSLGVTVGVVAAGSSSATTHSLVLKSWGLNFYGGSRRRHEYRPVALPRLRVRHHSGRAWVCPPVSSRRSPRANSFASALLANGTVRACGREQLRRGTRRRNVNGTEHVFGECLQHDPGGGVRCGPTLMHAHESRANQRQGHRRRGLQQPRRATNGTVVAWGANYLGQLGDGTAAGPDHICGGEDPVQPHTGAVFAGGRSTCTPTGHELTGVAAIARNGASVALLTNGTLVAWGESAYLGNGTTVGTACSNSCTPTPVVVCAVGGCTNGPRRGVKEIVAPTRGTWRCSQRTEW